MMATSKKNPSLEDFKPISVKSPTNAPFIFWLRCIIDLQLFTIVKYLKPALKKISGNILDVGAGQSPWCPWLGENVSYQGIDIGYANEFGMQNNRNDVIYYSGGVMPFDSDTFDNIMCIEVLEHAPDPYFLLGEMARVIRKDGTLIATVPFSARLHHLPHDYFRFTRHSLQQMLEKSGFKEIQIIERGNDIGAIANKLLILTVRLLKPKNFFHLFWSFPCGALLSILTTFFIAIAHISFYFNLGMKEDPLGYFILAKF